MANAFQSQCAGRDVLLQLRRHSFGQPEHLSGILNNSAPILWLFTGKEHVFNLVRLDDTTDTTYCGR